MRCNLAPGAISDTISDTPVPCVVLPSRPAAQKDSVLTSADMSPEACAVPRAGESGIDHGHFGDDSGESPGCRVVVVGVGVWDPFRQDTPFLRHGHMGRYQRCHPGRRCDIDEPGHRHQRIQEAVAMVCQDDTS